MEDIQRRVGQRIRTLRLERKLTQERLGERAGLSYKFVGEVERGVGNPTVGSLEALASALGVSIADLFGADQSTYTTLTARDFATVREVRDSLDAMLGRLAAVKTTRKRRPARKAT